MRHERIFAFVRDCQMFANASGEKFRRVQLEEALRTFATCVPQPENHAESLCIAGILEDLAVGLARHVHVSFHREYGGDWQTCGFDAVKVAEQRWAATRLRAADRAFVGSMSHYVDDLEMAHPVPVAVRAAQLLEEHFVEGITIPALARAVGCHPVRLRPLFRRRYNVTIRQYLTQYRLRRAAEGLHSSKLPVDEVAHRVGFGSRDHFYRAFVRGFGVTPAEYRRQMVNHVRSLGH